MLFKLIRDLIKNLYQIIFHDRLIHNLRKLSHRLWLIFMIGLITGCILILRAEGWLEKTELWLYDYYISLRPALKIERQIVILEQSTADINYLGHQISDHDLAELLQKVRQFKDEMQRVLMKQRILRKGCDSQEIFSVCDL